MHSKRAHHIAEVADPIGSVQKQRSVIRCCVQKHIYTILSYPSTEAEEMGHARLDGRGKVVAGCCTHTNNYVLNTFS